MSKKSISRPKKHSIAKRFRAGIRRKRLAKLCLIFLFLDFEKLFLDFNKLFLDFSKLFLCFITLFSFKRFVFTKKHRIIFDNPMLILYNDSAL